MHITPYKAMYFPNFIFLRKRLKSSHTSLKKLEKEDFNSINRYFISSLEDMSPPGELAFETLGRAHDKAEKRFILPWREKVRESAPMSKPQRIRHLRIVGMICKCSHKKFLNYRFLFLLTFPIRRKA